MYIRSKGNIILELKLKSDFVVVVVEALDFACMFLHFQYIRGN